MEKKQSNSIEASPAWVWIPPLIFLASAGIILLSGLNRDLFFLVNQFSLFTGERIWEVLTFLGDGLAAFVFLFPLIYHRPRWIWSVLIAALLFTIFGQAVKHLTQVPRPPQVLSASEFHLIGPALKYNSFPSGHSAMIFNLAGVFALTSRRGWLRIFLIAFALLAAVSRIAVGVHWPADVLAGAAAGWVFVWAGLRLSEHSPWGWTGWGQKILGAALLTASIVLFFSEYTGYPGIGGFKRAVALFFFFWGGSQYLRVWRASSGN